MDRFETKEAIGRREFKPRQSGGFRNKDGRESKERREKEKFVNQFSLFIGHIARLFLMKLVTDELSCKRQRLSLGGNGGGSHVPCF